jgi:hypothetical protein
MKNYSMVWRENFTEPVSTLKDRVSMTSINNERLNHGRSINKDCHEQITTNMYMILKI